MERLLNCDFIRAPVGKAHLALPVGVIGISFSFFIFIRERHDFWLDAGVDLGPGTNDTDEDE